MTWFPRATHLHRSAIGAYILLATLLFATPVFAAPVSITSSTNQLNLGPHVAHLVDPTGQLTLADVVSEPHRSHFAPVRKETPAFGFSRDAHWFELSLYNLSPRAYRGIVEIGYPLLDHIQVHVVGENMPTQRHDLGDTQPFAWRPIKHRNFLIPLRLEADQRITLYIRAVSTSSIQIPLTLWNAQAFFEADQQELTTQGIYFGILVVMLLQNLFVYLALRERSNLYYVAYVASLLGFVAALRGFGFQYLWPDSPWWHDKSIPVLIPLIVASGTQFSSEFLGLTVRSHKLWKLLQVIGIISLALAMLAFFLPYEISIKLAIGAVIPGCITILCAGSIMWYRGDKPARYFTIAWSCLLVGSIVLAANKLGLIPRNSITENSLQIGSIIEIVLLSFALAYRFNTLQLDHRHAEKQNLSLKQQLNIQLQSRLHIFSNVAHEINNPLNYITTGVSNLVRELRETDLIHEAIIEGSEGNPRLMNIKSRLEHSDQFRSDAIERLKTSTDQVARVIHEMRGLTEIDGRIIAEQYMPAVVHAALKRVEQAGGIDVQLGDEIADASNQDPGLRVETNPHFLMHAMTTILENACRFAKLSDAPAIAISAESIGDEVHVSVGNNGPPIPPKVALSLFEVDNQGMGTTLLIVRSLINQQGGDLTLSNTGADGDWVRFDLTVPHHQAGPSSSLE